MGRKIIQPLANALRLPLTGLMITLGIFGPRGKDRIIMLKSEVHQDP